MAYTLSILMIERIFLKLGSCAVRINSKITDSDVVNMAPSFSSLLKAVVLSILRILEIPSVTRKTVYPKSNKSRVVY